MATKARSKESFSAAPMPCCGQAPATPALEPGYIEKPWLEGSVETAAGPIPRVSTALRFADCLGSWKARWGIGRMRYRVEPGLYAAGRPAPESPVLVTANYKMSFDRLRAQLAGRDAWILVLDTNGINVWCAAGKGTFGTDELVSRAESSGLAQVVSHRTLIVPQLGAPGVSASEVKKRSGWRVVFGPIRAEDLPAFLDEGMKATPEMRRVSFPLMERLVLVPIELVGSLKYAAFVLLGFLLLSGLGPGLYSLSGITSEGPKSAALLVSAYLAGVVLVPLLLPWLPGRAFSAKGAWLGLALVLAVESYGWATPGFFISRLAAASWLFLIPAVASFLGMNFTGASTYTSLSGVRREMRIALPVQTLGTVAGLGLWIAGRFI